MNTIRTLLFGLGLSLLPLTAFGQDTSDDEFLDDILGEPTPAPDTSKQETKDLLRDADDETAAAESAIPQEKKKKRLIKTLQRKTFLKIGRWEASPHVGFVTNDPFINRYLVGTGFAYHITEIFALELQGSFSPDFGQADWKPITKQIVLENQVTPDISKIQYFGNLNFQFSPIYGKIALLGSNIIIFDVFGSIGTGFVNTKDDLEALQKTDDIIAQQTQVQNHPTLNFGGGARVAFSETFAFRLEGRGMSYIEVLESTTLEMKNNVLLLASASFFFPGIQE